MRTFFFGGIIRSGCGDVEEGDGKFRRLQARGRQASGRHERSTGGAAGPARRSRSPVRGANLGGGVAGPSVRARGRGAACWARRGPGGAARVGVGSRRRVCRCAAGAVGGARGRRGRAGRPGRAVVFEFIGVPGGFFCFFLVEMEIP